MRYFPNPRASMLNRDGGEIRRGDAVWAATGGYGWRPATVLSVGPKFAHLEFHGTREIKTGKRDEAGIRWRNLTMGGADKPTPLDQDPAFREARDLDRRLNRAADLGLAGYERRRSERGDRGRY